MLIIFVVSVVRFSLEFDYVFFLTFCPSSLSPPSLPTSLHLNEPHILFYFTLLLKISLQSSIFQRYMFLLINVRACYYVDASRNYILFISKRKKIWMFTKYPHVSPAYLLYIRHRYSPNCVPLIKYEEWHYFARHCNHPPRYSGRWGGLRLGCTSVMVNKLALGVTVSVYSWCIVPSVEFSLVFFKLRVS